MKKLSILLILITSTSVMARNEVDHYKYSQKCPSGYLYKLTEVNGKNKTTTFSCVADNGEVHPKYSFKIANWKSGDYLLEETVDKVRTKFTYNKEGRVNSVTQSINGVNFSNQCEFVYKGGKLAPTKDPQCKEIQKEYGGLTESIKHQVFCEPNASESECTTADGRVYRPSTKETGVLRYFYENGHVVDEQEVVPARKSRAVSK
ncbi:hypothetical protein [Halobacteriovorax sp. DA5]|uniref:hypothetical protein n=1 Tax=Halobacteriovorax sp. DA5 TaxID=2067553 RepID=UPI000CD1DC4C|nr:hypothetical protein [Halobacteriovorax sp. DA5]POB15155.1 hypothetical protein C0Z22_01885 [Halobacteriovorax sp. DA5]